MKKLIYFIAIVFLSQACKKENINNSGNGISGKFALSQASNLKSVSVSEGNDSASFVLDTVKSSRSFYFILSNVGQEDITDVTITTDNSNFSVTPFTITTLTGNYEGKTPLNQAISLDIVHGARINGIGYSGLLNMGDNTCNLTIKGQTFDGKSDVTIKLNVNIKIYAKLMAISLFQGTKEFDLTKPDGTVMGGPGGVSSMFQYEYKNMPSVVVKNTGNETINLSLINEDLQSTILQKTILNPKDTLVLNLPANSGDGFVRAFLKLDSKGTISDQAKLNIGTDGCGYISMINHDGNKVVTPIPNDSIKN